MHTRTWNLKKFAEWCMERGITRPSEVTRPIIERYRRDMFYGLTGSRKPYQATTQAHRLQELRGFFRWLIRNNLILSNPAADIEMPRQEERLPRAILTPAEVEKVLSLPDIRKPFGLRDRAIIETLYSTAIRRSELINLMLYDVEFDRGVVVIRLGKGRRDRMAPIGERALFWIRQYLARARPHLAVPPETGRLFLSQRGGPLSRNQLSGFVRRYILRAKLGKVGSCHLFRHSCATHMHNNGGDIRFIQMMLGHKDLTSTEIYTRVSIQKLKQIHHNTHPAATLDRRPAQSNPEEETYL